MTNGRVTRVVRGVIVLAVLCVVGGCADKHKRPPMAPVSGTVTFNGEPVEGATVQFQLADGSAPRLSTGLTDAAGDFTLTTYNTDDGAFVGSNLVAIIKTQMGSGKAMTAADLAATQGNPPVFKLLPEKFADPKTSGLKYEVESGSNSFNIKLKE